jgi:hypothetical protein
MERDWLILGPLEPWRSPDELDVETVTQRAVIQHLLAADEEAIGKLVAWQAGLQEALAAYDDVARRAPADLYAKVQAMWAWEHAERQRYGGRRTQATARAAERKHAELLTVYMALNGGALPERSGYGTVQLTAQQCGCSPRQVHDALKKAKKVT